jgi:hypothetical protein
MQQFVLSVKLSLTCSISYVEFDRFQLIVDRNTEYDTWIWSDAFLYWYEPMRPSFDKHNESMIDLS